MIFCTLFDSNYLDKGLALYYSMIEHIHQFRLYIFAFDSCCYKVLKDMHLKNVRVIYLDEIMTKELQDIREERTKAEFCWTCTPIIIEYVLLKYNESICTYLDADLYFFSSPENAIQEIVKTGCSVGIVEHGFERNYEYGLNIFNYGKYCVQFNTFVKNDAGLQILKEWKNDCLKWCFNRVEDGKLGDQRYLDIWEQKYSNVYVSKKRGLGLAPWNLHTYSEIRERDGKIIAKYMNEFFPVVFFHFQGMKYLSEKKVFLNLWNASAYQMQKRRNMFFKKYFNEVMRVRKLLEQNYHITFGHMVVENSPLKEDEFLISEVMKKYGCMEGIKKWLANHRTNIIKLK